MKTKKNGKEKELMLVLLSYIGMNMDEFTREFVYNPGHCYNPVKILLHFPLKTDVEELVYTLIRNNDLPMFKDSGMFCNISSSSKYLYCFFFVVRNLSKPL